MIVFLTTATGVLNCVPYLWAGYVTATLFVLLRPLYYSAMSQVLLFCSHLFTPVPKLTVEYIVTMPPKSLASQHLAASTELLFVYPA